MAPPSSNSAVQLPPGFTLDSGSAGASPRVPAGFTLQQSSKSGIGDASPSATALRETIIGTSALPQSQLLSKQQEVMQRLRAAGKSDADIENDPEFQAASRDLSRSVSAGNTSMAIGNAGVELLPVGRAVGAGLSKVIPAARSVLPGGLSRAQQTVSQISPGPRLPSQIGDQLRDTIDRRLTALETDRRAATNTARAAFAKDAEKRPWTVPNVVGDYETYLGGLRRSETLSDPKLEILEGSATRMAKARNFQVIDDEIRYLNGLFDPKASGADAMKSMFAGDLAKKLEGIAEREIPGYADYRAMYAAKSAPINEFETAVGKKITSETGEYAAKSFKFDSGQLPGAVFKSRDSVRTLLKLSGGDRDWVEANARAFSASQLDGVTQGATGIFHSGIGKGFSQADAAAKWARANQDWLAELPRVRDAVDAYIGRLKSQATGRAAAVGAGSAAAYLMAQEGVPGLAWLRHLTPGW